MSKPSAPTPPDPRATAQAATGTNVSTAIANAFLQNTNQNTPDGSLRYDVTGNYGWTDPSTGSTYNIPTFTATQMLSPQQKAIQDQSTAAKFNLAGMANAQSGRLSQHLASDINLSNAPAGGNADIMASVLDPSLSYSPGWDITKSYGAGDFSKDRTNVENALMARMNPQLARERGNIEQRLADQGIRYGSAAYTSAMDDYNRQANDARFAAVSQAGDEQARMMQMANQRAQFENAAQQQGYQQNALLAEFRNAGLAQQLAQRQSVFGARNAQRQQYLNEQYAYRNQPINEISALLSGSQISNPNFVNTPNTQIPTTDIAGLINNRFNQDMSVYQQQSQSYNSLVGGILGLGAGALRGGYISDEREKENKVPMGTVFAAGEDGERKSLPVYEYSYKRDPAKTRHFGPMAQDIEKIEPRAVSEKRGVKYVKPDMLMGSILRAA